MNMEDVRRLFWIEMCDTSDPIAVTLCTDLLEATRQWSRAQQGTWRAWAASNTSIGMLMKEHGLGKRRKRTAYGLGYVGLQLRPIFPCEHPVEAIGVNAVEQCLQCHRCGHVFWLYPEDVEAWLAWDGASVPGEVDPVVRDERGNVGHVDRQNSSPIAHPCA